MLNLQSLFNIENILLKHRYNSSVAGWQSGHAAACKAVYAGSIPASASKKYIPYAQVVELVDTRDLKSLEGNFVPVQVRLWAPMLFLKNV
jgi:hypothetical protein